MLYSRCAPTGPVLRPLRRGGRWKEIPTGTLTFPLGPYHPALPQPVALRLKLRGETIVGMEPPVAGYCRRDVRALAQGGSVEDALALVERSCALAGTAHRLALVQALEALAGVTPPEPARLTRVFFAEIERLLARLWLLGQTARMAGLPRLFRTALDQRETLYTALAQATGERVFWAVAVPGALRSESLADLEPIGEALRALEPGVASWQVAASLRGPLGRAGAGMGRLSAQRAEALALAGVAGHGAYAARDLRRDAANGGYGDLDIAWPQVATEPDGDVTSRLAVAAADLALSLTMAQTCLDRLDRLADGADSGTALDVAQLPAGREASATVEGPHGPATVTLTLGAGGTVGQLQLATGSSALLEALPEALEGATISQAPMILASLDLCPECLDL
jgi:Ni,Fe-hydrogenase III large subunit